MTDYPINMSVKPKVEAFFDPATNTISYVVNDPSSSACAVIDSVMDIDYAAGRITYDHADAIIDYIRKHGLKLEWIIETHVHADHLSAAPYIQSALGGKIGIGDKIMVVQDTFGKIFNEGTEFQRDGSQFDALFEDGDTYKIGNMEAVAIYTPAIRRHAWSISWATRLSWEIPCSCPMADRHVPISPAAMPPPFTIASRRFWLCQTRRACSCATTTAPMAATSSGKPRWPRKKNTTSMSAKEPRRSSS
ncbi:hypothetical protein HNQ96_005689 [Aminobacter lissarensis]|uniref:Metallo-beta-lactamase domain-containing protein n=1 Tax=Aminobacter carboxidus TaxID=376165 RepID=A0A8E2BGQ8_9HYPH|nr:hypothetical protein [Aminobacter lissarensis]